MQPMVKPSKTHEETINQNNLNYKKWIFIGLPMAYKGVNLNNKKINSDY